MKLIIDIDEQHFELIQMAVMNGMGGNAQKIIAQGIPLEQMLGKIRAEIEQNAYPIVHGVNNHEKGMTLYGILQIINKYTGG